ncbi:MAG: hypothetical protein AB7V39_20105 [Nitrospiraceae bacterium]
MIDPGVQFKAVERDTLSTDREFREVGSDFHVEAVAVHAQVTRRIPEAEEPRRDGLGAVVRRFHVRIRFNGRDRQL